MNKVFLIGNLTRDPETVKTQNGNKISRFDIAVNRRFTQDGEQKTGFFRVTSFRNLAEIVENYLTKGSKIALSGSINTTEWEDKEGNAHKGVEIVADEIEFISIKRLDEQPKPEEKSRRRQKY
nr:MAG TPA: Single strand binding protein [Caudoviricetes sp.]